MAKLDNKQERGGKCWALESDRYDHILVVNAVMISIIIIFVFVLINLNLQKKKQRKNRRNVICYLKRKVFLLIFCMFTTSTGLFQSNWPKTRQKILTSSICSSMIEDAPNPDSKDFLALDFFFFLGGGSGVHCAQVIIRLQIFKPPLLLMSTRHLMHSWSIAPSGTLNMSCKALISDCILHLVIFENAIQSCDCMIHT